VNLLRIIFRYTRKYPAWIALAILLQSISAIAALWLPELNAKVIDQGIATGSSSLVWHFGSQMLLACLIQLVAAILAAYAGAKVAMSAGADLRATVFHKVISLTGPQVHRMGAGTLITRSTNDVQQIQTLILFGLNLLVAVPVNAIGGIIMALRQDLSLSWLIVCSVLAITAAMLVFFFKLVPLFTQMQGRIDDINSALREQIMGIRVVRAFVREDFETEKYAQTNRNITKVSLQVGNYFVLMFPVMTAMLGISSAAVLYFGGSRVDLGLLDVGSMTAFMQYLAQIIGAVLMGIFVLMMVPRATVCAERITDVVSQIPEVTFNPETNANLSDSQSQALDSRSEIRHSHTDPQSSGTETHSSEVEAHGSRIEFKNITHRFSGAELPVLNNISFTAEPGTTTAIIGSTGSGKSTILNLLLRAFDATSGEIKIDGKPINELSRRELSETIGIVPQKPYLFSGSVASNLRFGNPEATETELWNALEVAQAADFVREMPKQLEEPVAQGGTSVSGGQRQRLAIARLLVTKPQVYLFDDSFSALDVATDARLRAALPEFTGDATTIVVAQRVSTIMNADQILVLDEGRLVGTGTHQELLENNAVYQEIVRSQMEAEDER
ncbi:MAG: ABC transporter ATP-binding protein, partial [Arcanobacterium sp.]|nr:ABC transporter ATP-binding protein [Arcanobacterium sp.]